MPSLQTKAQVVTPISGDNFRIIPPDYMVIVWLYWNFVYRALSSLSDCGLRSEIDGFLTNQRTNIISVISFCEKTMSRTMLGKLSANIFQAWSSFFAHPYFFSLILRICVFKNKYAYAQKPFGHDSYHGTTLTRRFRHTLRHVMVLRIQSWVEVQREKNDSSTWLPDSMVHKMSQAYSHQSYDVLN